MREELLKIIEKNSRIDLKELAVILGVEEIDVVNEMAAMEACGRVLPHPAGQCRKRGGSYPRCGRHGGSILCRCL